MDSIQNTSKSLVTITDTEGNILFSCDIEEREKALKFAENLDNYGVEYSLTIPSVSESLGAALQVEQNQLENLREELDEEIASHLPGCCHSGAP